jgi:hypothetical protein
LFSQQEEISLLQHAFVCQSPSSCGPPLTYFSAFLPFLYFSFALPTTFFDSVSCPASQLTVTINHLIVTTAVAINFYLLEFVSFVLSHYYSLIQDLFYSHLA